MKEIMSEGRLARTMLVYAIILLSLIVLGICFCVEYLNGRGNLALPRGGASVKWREPSPIKLKEVHWVRFVSSLTLELNAKRIEKGGDPDVEIYLDPHSSALREKYYQQFEEMYYTKIQDRESERRQLADIELYNFVSTFGLIQFIALAVLMATCCWHLFFNRRPIDILFTAAGIAVVILCGTIAIYRGYLTSF